MAMSFDSYMKDMVLPMRQDLTRHGINELLTPEQVTEAIEASKDGTMLLVINSVCGCAAGQCRPGVAKALQNEVKPDYLYTVFAGQEKEATAKAREYLAPYPPSSPSIAVFKNGELAHFIQRHQIEDRSADMIAGDLIGAFETYCK
ncbi:BrxA/BrxB family bacilliredoxin [Paenibacillus eucommiae]|uniref:YphP/YqiW family bacilliredoxin n=1 Tax=Paenibacillus eucommiae TaxID=1355755 RepID=A0ABS4IXP5_9BACL|nr:BrxA/BrxB family bacilliredoxin [Paenibacillus eucommiae]MBP1992364.1 putative YphP/YqiW family bacilliredoxin [Paenibacillus eucommiae]